MFAKNSSMDTHCGKFTNQYKEIISKFISAKNDGLTEITIDYLLKNTEITQAKLYDQIHELLELNILQLKEVSRCPYCSKVNMFNINKQTRCIKCKSVYNSDIIMEKFKLNEEKLKCLKKIKDC